MNRSEVILVSTVVSIAFGSLIAFTLYYLNVLPSVWGLAIAILVFSLLNPLIGKVFVAVGLRLCNAVDEVFHLPQKQHNYMGEETQVGFQCGNWAPNTQILLAAIWPITGPVIVVLALIALVFGLLFQSLFK